MGISYNVQLRTNAFSTTLRRVFCHTLNKMKFHKLMLYYNHKPIFIVACRSTYFRSELGEILSRDIFMLSHSPKKERRSVD